MDATITLACAALVATAAALFDVRWRRIPNWLTGAALLSGLFVNVWLTGAAGIVVALSGAGLGLALLLPFYALRAVGAGDVKLLAAIGALVGPLALVSVALFGALVGGALSLALLVVRGRLGLTLQQVMALQLPATGLKAPYAVAIAGGVYLAAFFGSLG